MKDKKILIVDDDPVTLEVLEKIFLSEGFWVAKATNGKEALYIANDFLPHIIILDIMMPVMDGAITLECLEENPRTRKIPVLFLTSLVSKTEESGKFAKGRCFLAKPIDKDKLIRTVAESMGKSKHE